MTVAHGYIPDMAAPAWITRIRTHLRRIHATSDPVSALLANPPPDAEIYYEETPGDPTDPNTIKLAALEAIENRKDDDDE